MQIYHERLFDCTLSSILLLLTTQYRCSISPFRPLWLQTWKPRLQADTMFYAALEFSRGKANCMSKISTPKYCQGLLRYLEDAALLSCPLAIAYSFLPSCAALNIGCPSITSSNHHEQGSLWKGPESKNYYLKENTLLSFNRIH